MDERAEQTDRALLRSAADDPAAFGVFFDRHALAILRFLHRRTDSAETAADLCAETFSAAFIHRRRFADTGSSARPWLYGIARDLLDHYLRREIVPARHRRRLGIGDTSFDDDALARVQELADVESYRAQIRAALSQLPEDVRDAVRLRVGQDLPYRDVAIYLGCSEGTARVQVSRALAALADLVEGP